VFSDDKEITDIIASFVACFLCDEQEGEFDARARKAQDSGLCGHIDL
jgi:hypothetical protein